MLTLPRAPRLVGPIVGMTLLAAIVVVLVVHGQAVALSRNAAATLALAAVIAPTLLALWRVGESREAFTPQLWISKPGLAFVADADHGSILRSLHVATRVLRWPAMAAFVVFASGSPQGMIVPLLLLLGPAFRESVPAVMKFGEADRVSRDRSVPKMFQWRSIRTLGVHDELGGIVSVRAELKTHFATSAEIRFRGPPAMAEAVRKLLGEHAEVEGGNRRVVLKPNGERSFARKLGRSVGRWRRDRGRA